MKAEVPTEEEKVATEAARTTVIDSNSKATRLSKCAMASLKALYQNQLKLKPNLRQQHLRNRAPRLLYPGLKWCLRGLAGVMHNRLFSRNFPKRRNLRLRLKNLSRLKTPKVFLRCNQSLKLKKAQSQLKKLKHCHLRRNIIRKVIDNRNSLKISKKERLNQNRNLLKIKK